MAVSSYLNQRRDVIWAEYLQTALIDLAPAVVIDDKAGVQFMVD